MNNYYGGPATDLIFGFPSRKERETVLPKKILPVKKIVRLQCVEGLCTNLYITEQNLILDVCHSKTRITILMYNQIMICISRINQLYTNLPVKGLEVVRFQISTILLKCVF